MFIQKFLSWSTTLALKKSRQSFQKGGWRRLWRPFCGLFPRPDGSPLIRRSSGSHVLRRGRFPRRLPRRGRRRDGAARAREQQALLRAAGGRPGRERRGDQEGPPAAGAAAPPRQRCARRCNRRRLGAARRAPGRLDPRDGPYKSPRGRRRPNGRSRSPVRRLPLPAAADPPPPAAPRSPAQAATRRSSRR